MDEYEQPQSYPPQQAMISPVTEGMLQYQIECNEIIEEVEHTLKGEFLSFDKQSGGMTWVGRKGVSALINEEGINTISTIMRSRLTKIFVLSDFDQQDISFITIKIGEDLIDDIYLNWELYGIKSISSASIVLGVVTDTVYATLRKGYLGSYMKGLRAIHSIQEIQHRNFESPQQQQNTGDNFLAKLFGRRR